MLNTSKKLLIHSGYILYHCNISVNNCVAIFFTISKQFSLLMNLFTH